MKIKLDPSADALYIQLTKNRVQKTIATSDSFLVDVDRKGNVVGIEVLNYSKIVPQKTERSSIVVGHSKLALTAH